MTTTAQPNPSKQRERKVAWLIVSGTVLFIGGLLWFIIASTNLETTRARAEVSSIHNSGDCWMDLFKGRDCEPTDADEGSLPAQRVLSGLLTLMGLGLFVGGIVVHRRGLRVEQPATTTPVQASLVQEDRRLCPDCGESIAPTARICRFCRASLAT